MVSDLSLSSGSVSTRRFTSEHHWRIETSKWVIGHSESCRFFFFFLSVISMQIELRLIRDANHISHQAFVICQSNEASICFSVLIWTSTNILRLDFNGPNMEAAITTRHPLGLRRTTNRLPQPWSSKMWFRPASTSFILMRPLLPPPPTPSLEEKSGTVREMASGNKRLTAPFECWFRLYVFFLRNSALNSAGWK